ncbi:MAG: hypothetical protein M1816_008145 [Peltula sp. TS41687]|nr:MAG: hypothetical protein M1816_008145 [Peltula sp. TS41687]
MTCTTTMMMSTTSSSSPLSPLQNLLLTPRHHHHHHQQRIPHPTITSLGLDAINNDDDDNERRDVWTVRGLEIILEPRPASLVVFGGLDGLISL